MRLATWNVNSIRTRLPHVTQWLETHTPDVLCLQETKVINDDFPHQPFHDLGYKTIIHGQKSYNGVAFIAKESAQDVVCGFQNGDLEGQTRVLQGTFNGVRVMNLYVPQGENVDSPKFLFKEAFYAALQENLLAAYHAETPLIVCGDMNIAPAALDVYDAEKVVGRCMFTDMEKEWLARLRDWGLVDSFRALNPEDPGFSWWDYRLNSFERNKGWRIDHIYATQPVLKQTTGVWVDRTPRGWERPSDHVPVVIDVV